MESDSCLPVHSAKKENRWLKVLKRRLPIVEWAPRYSRLAALGDLVAGVTLGLTLVPQSIAYAALADLPVHYGLYSAFVGTILYMFVGTVKEVSIGPTSLMALLTLQTCRGLPVDFVVLLTFLSGCVVLLMGVLRLGFLVELISASVTSGFTSATAVIIVCSQLKGALGLSFTAESVLDNARQILARWRLVRLADCLLALACCAVLLLLRSLKDVKVGSARMRKALWLASIARNALVVLAAALLAYCTHRPGRALFKLSGRVEPGLPMVALPAFSARVGNETLGFAAMAGQLGPTLLMMPVVMVVANIAIAKAFSGGARVDATQEMVSLGLCNAAGALCRAMPTSGAFTRSAVAHSSGVRTPAAGLYAGIISLLALIFMTEYFYYIPKACLSSVLICAVIFMIDYATVIRLWHQSKGELAVLCVTFATSVLATVELGVLAGVLADLARLVRALMAADLQLAAVKAHGGGRGGAVPAGGGAGVPERGARAGAGGARRRRACARAAAARLRAPGAAAEQSLERLAKKLQESKQQLIPFNASAQLAARLRRLRHVDARALRAETARDALAAARRCGARAPLLPPAAAAARDAPDAEHDED